MKILICGVGGQGTLFASRVFGEYAAIKNLDCKISEVHGMAQRGGSVVTHVKFGEKIFSPIIEAGDADCVVAFEKLEAIRMAHYLKENGVMLVNDLKISPMTVTTGAAEYPQDIFERLKSKKIDLHIIDAMSICQKIGSLKTLNTVMLGLTAKILNLDYEIMLKAVESRAPEKFKAINTEAFIIGFQQ